jgi:sugar phosphate isomerase/epimerase
VIAACRRAGRPILAVLGTPFASESSCPSLDAPDETQAERARDAITATRGILPALLCRRLILPIGRAGLADLGEESPRAWRAAHRGAREQAADTLCRRLFALCRSAPEVQHLLLPSGNPGSLLDPESVTWVLDEVRATNLGLALDTGLLGWRAMRGDDPVSSWFAQLGARVALVLVADHDGSRGDLNPGMGLLDLAAVRDGLARAVPRVLRPDPTLPEVLLQEVDADVRSALGSPE